MGFRFILSRKGDAVTQVTPSPIVGAALLARQDGEGV